MTYFKFGLFVVSVIATTLISRALSHMHYSAGGFVDTCEFTPQIFEVNRDTDFIEWYWNGDLYIKGHCMTSNGTYGVMQKFYLDECFGNDDGNLTSSSFGRMSMSCKNCSLDGTMLACTCDDKKQVPRPTSIDLNATISSNEEGQFVCYESPRGVDFDFVWE